MKGYFNGESNPDQEVSTEKEAVVGSEWDKDSDNLNIITILGKERLEDIQRKISKVTGLAFITVDYKGEPITEVTNFTGFCQKWRSKPEQLEICRSSDAFGSIQATVKKKPCVYFCPCGLLEVAIPIVIDGHYLGGFVGGQVRCEDAPEDVIHLNQVLRYQIPSMQNGISRKQQEGIEKYHFENFMDVANLVFMIINLLTENEINRRMEKQQLKKEIKKVTQSRQKHKEISIHNGRMLDELRAKMNPYGLLDLLTLATNYSVVEKAEKTNQLLMELTKYLKYTFSTYRETVSLKAETDNAECYLRMQKEKYGELFSYSIHMEEGLKNESILPYVLLPYVQNAVFFGSARNVSQGKVDIHMSVREEQIIIRIEDNGPGLTESEKDRKFAKYGDDYEGYNIRVAMQNAAQKLEDAYNQNAGIELVADKGKGTVCIIHYPAH